MKIFIFVMSALMSQRVLAEEEGGAAKDRIGPRKAVVAANQKQVFKLSEKALKTLELELMPIENSRILVPRNALIQFQDFAAIYRLRDGWFRIVEVEPAMSGERAMFSSKEFKPGDKVVVKNGSLLRVVELDVFGPEADACAD